MSVTKGHSTTIEYGNQKTHTDSTTWTPLAGVTGVTPPKVQADDIEVTNMETPDQIKEFEAGYADGGEVEFQVQFKGEQGETVYGLFRQNKGFRITFSDESKWAFSGYIKAYGDEVEREGIVTTSVTIKVSGKPVFTKAAA